jgi:hypothetical protein
VSNKGHDNLIPLTERTKDEQREIRQKGGKASGRARRRKANLKRTMETLLKMDVPDSKLKDKLIEMGIDPSMEQGLSLSVLLTAMQSGDHQAFKTIRETIQQTTTLADRREQKARTEKIQAEAELMKQDELGADVLDDGFLDALEGKAGKVWQEESQED